VAEPWDPVVSAGLWTYFVATLDKVQYNYCMHACGTIPMHASAKMFSRNQSEQNFFNFPNSLGIYTANNHALKAGATQRESRRVWKVANDSEYAWDHGDRCPFVF
jgi:hypothetical protein